MNDREVFFIADDFGMNAEPNADVLAFMSVCVSRR
jgi:hypothetical protein